MKKVIAVDFDDLIYPFAEVAIEYVSRVALPVTGLEIHGDGGVTQSGMEGGELTRYVEGYLAGPESLSAQPIPPTKQNTTKPCASVLTTTSMLLSVSTDMIRHLSAVVSTDSSRFFSGVLFCGGYITHSLESLKRISRVYDVQIITSRAPELEENTRRWITASLTGLDIKGIVFVGNIYVHKKIRSKREVCDELGAVFLVDDLPRHAEAMEGSATRTILFGDYEWNEGYNPSHVTRAAHWPSVEKIVLGEAYEWNDGPESYGLDRAERMDQLPDVISRLQHAA